MSSPAPSAPIDRTISRKEHLALSTFWAASNFVWGALLIIIIPSQIKQLVSAEAKGLYTGLTVSVGAIAALLIPLVIGPLSDRCRHRLGRRRPYIFVGVAINLVGLLLVYLAYTMGSVALYVLFYFVMTLGNNVATGAYSGVIPDLVPENQRGVASGYMAVMSQLGTLAGIVISGILAGERQYLASFLVLVVALLLGLWVSMKGIHETPISEAAPMPKALEFMDSLVEPLRYADFRWVWITRALVMLGFYMFVPLLQYYLSDVINVDNPEVVASQMIAIVIFAAALSGYVGGALSDRIGRKRIVYFANSFMAAIMLMFIFCTTITHVLIAGVLFGIGYGAYISVDWALGTDVLPSKEDAAKDMAVWHISMTLPQAVAAFPAGLIVRSFGMTEHVVKGEVVKHYTHAGFAALFIIGAIFLGSGALLLRNVKGST